jgi:hypothetical protein
MNLVDRGFRNNNPGNIILDGTQWEGMAPTQTDGTFVQFTSVLYGIRAMNKILDSYAARGLVTINQIIPEWSKTDVAAYITDVSNWMGIDPDTPLTDLDRGNLIAAIINQENGSQPYDMATIEAGITLA